MRKTMAAAAMAVLVLTGHARADLEEFAEICSSPNSTAHQIVQFCKKAIDTGRLGPKAKAQVYANLGIGYFELEQYLGAIDASTRALEAYPRMVAALLTRARAYEKLQRLQEAAADFEKALYYEPNSANAYMGRGIMLLRHGKAYEAITDLSKALVIQPELPAALFNRGIAYLEIGQPSRAEQDFTGLLRLNGNDAEAYLFRGQARAALNLDTAAKDFDRAVSLASEWGMAWFVRGRYRDRLGDVEGANADFLRANELGHDDPWLIERMRQISG